MSTFNEAFDLRTLPEIMCSEQFELRRRNQTRCDAGRTISNHNGDATRKSKYLVCQMSGGRGS